MVELPHIPGLSSMGKVFVKRGVVSKIVGQIDFTDGATDRLSCFVILLSGLMLSIVAGCGGSGSQQTTTTQITAPSGLSYAQQDVTATIGTAVQDKPTVTGSVTSYSVSPTLPAGLSLDSPTRSGFRSSYGSYGKDCFYRDGVKFRRDDEHDNPHHSS